MSRNLRRGRFLLLIIGDGIRENVEQITNFLQKYAHLNFSFALVEFGIFKLPGQDDPHYFIQPRVIMQTVEIERAVFRIEDNQILAVAPPVIKPVLPIKRLKISEQIFFEKLNADEVTKIKLKVLFEQVQSIGLYVEPGQNSMILKSSKYGINLGVFTINGEFYNCGIASTTQEMGAPQIGEEYLSQLAKLFDNGFVKPNKDRFSWTVKIKTEKGDRYAKVTEVLAIQERWLKTIEMTLDEISKLGVL